MATHYLYIRSGSNAYEMSARTWALGDRMWRFSSDWSSNSWSTGEAWVWECTTAGTTTDNKPSSWPASATQDVTTVSQNGVVFTARKPGYSSGTTMSWLMAAPGLGQVAGHLTYGLGAAADDMVVLCIAHDHFEPITNYGYAPYDAGPLVQLSVDATATPPTTTLAGADVGGGTLSGNYAWGITAWSVHTSINIDCSARYGVSGLAIRPKLLNNREITDCIALRPGCYLIDAVFIAGVASPDLMLRGPQAEFRVQGLDMSAAGVNTDIVEEQSYGLFSANSSIRGVKLPAGWVGEHFVSPYPEPWRVFEDTVFPGISIASGLNPGLPTKYLGGECKLSAVSSVYRDGGAKSVLTPTAYKVEFLDSRKYWVQIADIERPYPANAAEDTAWVAGTSKTLTLHLIHDSVTNLNSDDIWVIAAVQDEIGSAMTSAVGTVPFPVLGPAPSDLAASSETWTGVGGMTNPNKQKLMVTVTPQTKGSIILAVFARLANKTLYLCPRVEMS